MYINQKKTFSDVPIKKIAIRILCGVKQIYRMKYGKQFYFLLIGIMLYSWTVRKELFYDINSTTLINANMIARYLIYTLAILFACSKPYYTYKFAKGFYRANIVNHISDAPILYDIICDDGNKNIVKYVFLSQGIPLTFWQEKIPELENCMNLSIHSIEQGKNKQFIELLSTSGNYKFPDILKWNDSYIHDDDTQILLGESYGIKKYADISKSPSFLIGGSTGSGKSILLKNILYQFIKREHIVFIADFKGGVDYGDFWYENTQLIFDKNTLITILEKIITTLEERKAEYREKGYANILKHNEHELLKQKRIIFACDEVAELLDKNGLDKEEKEQVNKIERMISTIARQGRAFGIHLVLATQRPDATILTGQIKNNIEHRLCGRCEKVLSQIILDTSSGAELVPKNSVGMFLDQDETLIKGYYMDI